MTTITLPVTFTADLTVEAATEAYRAADTSTKAAMRAGVKSAITDAVMSADVDLAQHLVSVESGLTAAPKSTASTVDYGQRIADTHATLLHAIELIERGEFTLPDGVTFEGSPDLSAGVHDPAASAKLVTIGGRKSGRGSVGAYVEAHLGDEPMTVSALRRAFTPTEAYATAAPSAGAIAAWADRLGDDDAFEVTAIEGTKAIVRK